MRSGCSRNFERARIGSRTGLDVDLEYLEYSESLQVDLTRMKAGAVEAELLLGS